MKLSVVILAGGIGSRMRSSLPKSLHKVNKIAMITRIINTTLSLNPDEIIVLCSPLTHEQTKNVVDNDFRLSELYLKIKYKIQPKPNGTGHAALYSIIDMNNCSNVLILNGDSPFITIQTLKKMIKTNTPKLVISRKTNPSGNGRIICGINNEIVRIIEEKDCTDIERNINIVNGGMYYINRSLLKDLLSHVKNNNNQKEYYITDIIQIYNDLYKKYFKGIECNEYELQNINTREQLQLCNNICNL
jgi:bifunctional UDP-N-acetylglucosamine pyrophosphorylase/glucosamine-1-phosphate N-acetyltransferase